MPHVPGGAVVRGAVLIIAAGLLPHTVRAAPDARTVDPELRRLARETPAASVGAVLELHAADPSVIRALQARGVAFRQDHDGQPLHLGAFYPVDAAAGLLREVPAEGVPVRVGRPHPRAPTAQTGDDVTIWAAQASGPTPVDGPDGSGITILDIDPGIDLYHPHFFRADGGAVPWVDLDGDGVLTPAVDGVDANLDGEITEEERLQLLDYTSVTATTTDITVGGANGELDPWYDYVYLDFNGNGVRDYGSADGYSETSPGYGEAMFLPDDANGDGVIDRSERVILLGSSKIAAFKRASQEFKRGEDLIDAPRDDWQFANHGTAVVGELVGGQDRVYRAHRGLLPGADVALFAHRGAQTEADFIEGIAWGVTDAGATVVLHEYAEWYDVHLDGGRALDLAIDASAQEGVLHVCPAGNLASSGKHAHVVAGPEPASLSFFVPLGFAVAWAHLDLHWPDTAAGVSCTLTTPQDASVVLAEGEQSIGSLSLSVERFDSPRGTAMLSVRFDGALTTGSWFIDCEHDASELDVHAYVADSRTGWDRGITFGEEVDETTLCSPATSDGCLAVGAYRLNHPMEGPSGALAADSSRGPRMNGGKTIDLAAPNDPWVPFPQVFDPDATNIGAASQNFYRNFGGTSGAAPHVAAAAALLQQAEPELSASEVRDRLTAAAATDQFAEIGDAPDDSWGHGKLRTHEALFGEPAPARPEFVQRDLSVEFVPADGACAVEVSVADADWETPTFRWDDDYDGSWDTAFVEGATHRVVVEPGATDVSVRAEFGAAGWRVGGAAITAEVPAACFEEGGSTEGDGTTTDAPQGETTADGGSGATGEAGETAGSTGAESGCGCRGSGHPSPWSLLVLLALWRRSARRRGTGPARATAK